MRLWDWSAWDLDIWTWGWIAWIAFFIVWEIASSMQPEREMLTNHLRPVFNSSPPLWFLTVGIWAWMGWHFLLEVGNPFAGN